MIARCAAYVCVATVLLHCASPTRSGTGVTPARLSEAHHQSPAASAQPEAGLDCDALLLAAQSYLDGGHANDAIAVCTDAARLCPQRPEPYILWGRGLAQSDQLEASAARYEQARHLGSRDAVLFAELASVYDVSKRYDAAVAVYRDYLTDHPRDAAMRDELALTLLLVDRPEQAVSELEIAAVAQPNSAQIRQDLGYAYVRAERFPEAIAALLWTVNREPQRSEAKRFLAQAYAGMGELERAKNVLDQLLSAAPRDRAARVVRARLRARDGAPAAALADYNALLAENPDDPPTLLGAAGALIALRRLDDAQPLIARARAQWGQHPQVKFRQAQIDWRRGQHAAISIIEELARSHPRDDEVWEELAIAAQSVHDIPLAKQAAEHLQPRLKAH